MGWDFIAIAWTPGVTDADARILLDTLEHIFKLLRMHFGAPGQFDPLPSVKLFGAWHIPDAPEGTPYSSVMDYVHHGSNDHHQLVASRYLDAVRREPWQNTHPHFDLALTEMPLLNDLNGSSPTHPAPCFAVPNELALISLYPLREVTSPAQRKHSITHMTARAVGHLFAALDRPDAVEEVNGHRSCTHSCAMHYETDRREHLPGGAAQGLWQQRGSRNFTNPPLLCARCQKELVARLTSFHFGCN